MSRRIEKIDDLIAQIKIVQDEDSNELVMGHDKTMRFSVGANESRGQILYDERNYRPTTTKKLLDSLDLKENKEYRRTSP